jgi:Bacterial Ig domain/Dockerin type I domain/Bacterial pre-peptidase C-terminal domain
MLTRLAGNETLATGAIFEDKNKSGWYEAGEGIGGAQIVFQGPAGTFSTTSLTAGGYQIVLPAGTYTATASGGGMAQSITVPNIVVGTTNVWKDLIYDPTVVAHDGREPNDSAGAATALTSSDQTLAPLTIHANDVDYFRFTSASTGNATINLSFTHVAGNLDLRLMDASGSVLATSATNADKESITFGLTRGSDYYVSVYSSVNATNRSYVLQLDLPEPVAPTAVADRAIMDLATSSSIVIPVTANDSDPDGSTATLRPTIVSSNNGSFIVDANSVVFTPTAQFTGFASGNYTVTDDQGLQSSSANISVFVVDLSRTHPWLNPRRANDVNDDGVVSALDALLVISDLVTRGSRELPKNLGAIGNTRGFVDVSESDSVEPRDVLLIIDELNRTRPGSAEGESNSVALSARMRAADLAIMQLQLPDDGQDPRRRKR